QRPPRRPECKIGPFHNGLGVAVWLNEVETPTGARYFRSITIAPRRFRDEKTGEWKDAASFRPVDLATLGLALEKAQDFMRRTPLPGQPVEGEEMEEMPHPANGEAPPNGEPVPF